MTFSKFLGGCKSTVTKFIHFLSSPQILIIAFTAKLLITPIGDYAATVGLIGTLLMLGFQQGHERSIDYSNKLAKQDLDNKKAIDQAQIKKWLETQDKTIGSLQQKLDAFEVHNTLHSATMPNGMFNVDPRFEV